MMSEDSISSSAGSSALYASVLLVCGLPSSGKSTAAELLFQQANQLDDDLIICSNCALVKKTASFFQYDEAYLINYDDITEKILLTLMEVQEEENGSIHKHGKEEAAENCHYFDNVHLQAWREARNEANQRLIHFLTPSFRDNVKVCAFCSTNIPRRILIILDDNFHLRSMRRDVFRLCQSCTVVAGAATAVSPVVVGFSVLVLNTNPSLCKDRNSKRLGRSRVPEAVMDNMISTIEFPKVDKSSLWITSTNQSDLMHQINALFQPSVIKPIPPLLDAVDVNLVAQREEDALSTIHSRLHSIDRLLRHLVGIVCDIDKSFANRANKSRKKILEECRQRHKESRRVAPSDDDSCQAKETVPENQDICKRFIDAMLLDGLGNLSINNINKISDLQYKVATNGSLFFT